MTNTAIIKRLAERIEREAPAVLEGWKLVPVEPTQAMVDAYLAANLQYWKTTDELPTPPNRWRTGTASAATCESYRAMLAAAPQQAPQAKSDAEKLATAIAEAATRAGITDSKIHGFSGPQLLMLLDDLIELAITKPQQAPQASRHRYELELPEGERQTIRLAWSEHKEQDGEILHHLCVSIQGAAPLRDR